MYDVKSTRAIELYSMAHHCYCMNFLITSYLFSKTLFTRGLVFILECQQEFHHAEKMPDTISLLRNYLEQHFLQTIASCCKHFSSAIGKNYFCLCIGRYLDLVSYLISFVFPAAYDFSHR